MTKLFQRIVCSLLISTMTLSGMPNTGVTEVKADEIELKETQVEQILNSSSSSYDLILFFRDDSIDEDAVYHSQKGARSLLDDAVSHGLADAYKVFEPINAISVKVHDEAIVKELAALEDVVELQENQVYKVDFPTEPVRLMARSFLPETSDGIEWGVKAIHADKVWEEYGLTGEGVTVGIIDTGVNYNLPSLKNAFMGNYRNSDPSEYYRDFTREGSGPGSSNDHGTHVAGIIVGNDGSDNNRTGVAPGAKFISAKAVSENRQYSNTTVLEAFLWLIEKDVDIINCSFGAPYSYSNAYLEKAIELAESKNIAVVISSGNVKANQNKGLLYPAATGAGGIVVGSVNQNLQLSSFSARGPSLMRGMEGVIRPDVVAPGELIRSTMYSGRFGILSGTSQAAPHVTGVIALMKEAKPDITPNEIKSILKATSQALTDSEYRTSPNMGYGYGLVNAYDAVSSLIGRKMGSIYGTIRPAGPRVMSAYEGIAAAGAVSAQELSSSADETSQPDLGQNSNTNLPISDAANPSNDSSAGPGEVIGTTAPSMEGETAISKAPLLESEATSESSAVESGSSEAITEESFESQSLPEYGAPVATASEAVQNSALSTNESVFMTESNQSHSEDELIKSQSYGEKDHFSSVEESSTNTNESSEDGLFLQSEDTGGQEVITPDELVENNGIYNVGVTPQSIHYIPISLQNLNLNIPFRPMVKVLSSGKGVFADANGNYSMTHSVNPEGKPLKLEISAYGYETKVIDVDLNTTKDQQQDIILDPAPLATAEGRLTDDSGNPLKDGIVHILEDQLIENVRTSEDGSYRINAAYRGVYTIMFSKKGYLTKTMRVGLKAGENQLKDVRLYPLSNPVDVSITNGIDSSVNGKYRIEVLSYGDEVVGGAVRFAPPQNDSILKSASLYMMAGDEYRGNEISIGVLGEQDGRLVERIPFQDYRVNAEGWVTFDLSSYYLYSKEPIYVVYLYRKTAAQSIGVGVIKNAGKESADNSFLFNGDLYPFRNIVNYSGYGIAMTTDWLSGVLSPDATEMEDNHDFNPDEFGPTHHYQIQDKVIEINPNEKKQNSGNSGHSSGKVYPTRESDDGGLKQTPEQGGTKNSSVNSTMSNLDERDLREIDTHIYSEKNNTGQSGAGDVDAKKDILNGYKSIQGHRVPADTVEGEWIFDSASSKWILFVDGVRMANRWVRVFTPKPTAQGTHDSWFHFNRDGEMTTGFFRDTQGRFYYLNETKDSSEGELALEWKKINGDFFYFRNDGSDMEGAMLTGWMKTADNKRYYFHQDGDRLGTMATGWVAIAGKEYYFSTDANSLGELKSVKKENIPKSDPGVNTSSSSVESTNIGFSPNNTSAKDTGSNKAFSVNVGVSPIVTSATDAVSTGAVSAKDTGSPINTLTEETVSPDGVSEDRTLQSDSRAADEQDIRNKETSKSGSPIVSNANQELLIGPGEEFAGPDAPSGGGVWEPTPKEGLIYVDEALPYTQFFLTVSNTDSSKVAPDSATAHALITETTVFSPLESAFAKEKITEDSTNASNDGHHSIENAIEESEAVSSNATIKVVSDVKKAVVPDRSAFYPLIELE